MTTKPPTKFQPNRLFSDEAELAQYVATFPKATVVKQWTVRAIACEVEIPNEPPKTKKK